MFVSLNNLNFEVASHIYIWSNWSGKVNNCAQQNRFSNRQFKVNLSLVPQCDLKCEMLKSCVFAERIYGCHS